MDFGKKRGELYFGIPSGSLHDQVLRILDKAGYPLEKSRRYELVAPCDATVVFRVLDRKEMAEKVRKGVVDCGITGKDYIFEAGLEQDVQVLGDFIFSKRTNQPSRIVLASRPENGIESPRDCVGKTIATELPNLTRRRMRELFDIRDISILHSEGKTEAKVVMGESDAFTDITETGETLKANGNNLIAEIFTSNPQLIANEHALGDRSKHEKMEDIRICMEAVLSAEKEPVYMVFMDVPTSVLLEVEELLPAVVSPTVSPVVDESWRSVSVVIKESELNILAPRLLRLGVDGIVPVPVPKVFTQEMVGERKFGR
ncbi:MAG: ATP phosphoribosyltransferase [Pseudomonadales bacterium]|jgi:ATP phosphoribosyltransferase|nr:ATP phosphoribosyltransferase [Pseudomonadales bacterium]MDP6470743.1 ATP phosphoribosyltransferase [Pseudomonadales bacterium]MDP6828305.1 ATP phosphoribosyltransferase [Pseudomonadales bacterium]MDP6972145.1 ATP phosphoribosyltransferase [Pseudomonadales bacterium]|tara:strand:+ start:1308 stop:2252 length:945 start_codon:yes stop_codon:yes gene_type:complete